MPPVPTAAPRRPLAGALFRGAVAGLVLAAVAHAGYVLLGLNFHTVLPGAVYRCAQPSPASLERLIRAHGIRTVINLRGCCDPSPWYLEQCRVVHRRDVSQEDVSFSAARLPSAPALRQLVEVLDGCEYPILLHCHKGADRTGLASALVLLLRTDATLAEARRQLGPRYGHLPIGRTRNMDRFFDLYERWLAGQGVAHSPEALRRWALREYCPGECRATITPLGPVPAVAPRGQPFALRVRCTNTAVEPWRLEPGPNAGVLARWDLQDEAGAGVGDGRAGLFRAAVPPGGHVDLTLALPPLHRPGRYTLRVDMRAEQHGQFLQFGSPPLVWELEVP